MTPSPALQERAPHWDTCALLKLYEFFDAESSIEESR